jgi:hypothetical protein
MNVKVEDLGEGYRDLDMSIKLQVDNTPCRRIMVESASGVQVLHASGTIISISDGTFSISATTFSTGSSSPSGYDAH